jgi:hypothetical protein
VARGAAAFGSATHLRSAASATLLHAPAAGASAARLGTGLHALLLCLRELNLAGVVRTGCHWCDETKCGRCCKG